MRPEIPHRHPLRARRIGLCLAVAAMAASSLGARAESLLSTSGDAGVGGIDGRAAATLQIGVDVREGNLALGLHGRVRLLFAGDAEGGAIRRRDFDEPSDYLAMLRYLHYRRSFGAVGMRVEAGAMFGTTLGHGSLLRDYSNMADPNSPHTGLRFTLSSPAFDFSALLDNPLSPTVVATRVDWRPFSGYRRLTFGATLVVDPQAPLAVRTDEDGQRLLRPGFNLDADTEVLALTGLDAQIVFGSSGSFQVTPYTDFNTSWRGVGFHAGALLNVPLDRLGLDLSFQGEYRVTSGGYAPTHMGTFYEVDRFQASLASATASDPGADPATLLRSLNERAFGGHGALAQLGVGLGKGLSVKAGYRFHPGPDNHRLWLRTTFSPIERLTMGTMVMMRGLEQLGQSANGLGVLAEVRFRLTPYMYLLGQYTRTWALEDLSLVYAPWQSFNAAFGGSWSG